MALAPVPPAVGGGAGCADFWRFSAVFWFHAGIRIPATGQRGQRIKAHVSRPAGAGSITGYHGQRIRCRSPRPATGGASGAANFPEKLTGGQRITGRGMFQGINGRRGAAGLTG